MQHSELNRADTLALARMLLSEELVALQKIADGERDPVAEHQNWADEFRAATVKAVAPAVAPAPVEPQAKISLDELFSRWEAEADPSASTLSSWRGIVRDLKAFLSTKADDIGQITSDDVVG